MSAAPCLRRDKHAELYSRVESRPNFPVNIWVGLEIIKGMFDYTDQELLEQFHFNLLTSYALGQENLGEISLSERTIYYNRERLLEYEAKTGRNLLEEEFHAITDDALAQLSIDAKTQRMDSSFIGSFIKQMSRLELIVKVLQNFYHDLPKAEQTRWASQLAKYVEDEAKHISYYLRRTDTIPLEPDSDGRDGPDSHGDAYHVHRDIGAWGHVAARADTEADAHIAQPADRTKVYVWVRLYFWDGQKWVLKASDWNWTDQQCRIPQPHEYDVDVVVRAPLWAGWWMSTTWHRVYRDGVRTASRGQSTPPQLWEWVIPQDETRVAP
ncbi:transposase [Dehalococcoidia bacterium]|nr:transposase [Dehalococcoidia bacterium]